MRAPGRLAAMMLRRAARMLEHNRVTQTRSRVQTAAPAFGFSHGAAVPPAVGSSAAAAAARSARSTRSPVRHERGSHCWQPRRYCSSGSGGAAPVAAEQGKEYDYIIVGAGSAGCILAHRLSAGGAYSVLLLESGPRDTNMWLHLPVGYYKTTHDPRFDWCFKTEQEAALNNRRLGWPRGRVLGGSSSINGMLHVRGQPEDYDAWALEHGCNGWSYEEILPYFRKSEDQEGGDRELHGKGGPLSISNARISLPIADAFLHGCAEVGIGGSADTPLDLNGRQPEGAGYCQTTQRNGWRCSTATAYLKSVKNDARLTIETQCTVRRVMIETRKLDSPTSKVLRATGVEYFSQVEGSRSGRVVSASARKEVVLSAGTIGSPHLLMLSGVGEPEQLEAAGVAVVHSLPGVGKNLQDHLQVRSVFKSRCPTINDAVRSPIGLLQMAWQFATTRTGPLTMAPTPVIALGRSVGSTEGTPDVQIHFGPWTAKSRQTGWWGMSPFRVLDPYSAFTMTVCQLRPRSRGEVRLPPAGAGHECGNTGSSTSGDQAGVTPLEPPLIYPNYLSDPYDLATAVGGLKLVRQVARSDALGCLIEEELSPCSSLETDAQLAEHVRAYGESIYHPVGTCKMGPAIATDAAGVAKQQTSEGTRAGDECGMSVVCPRLKVHGIEGLRVVDASVMPTIVSGNTNAATIMLAEKGSDMILEHAAMA